MTRSCNDERRRNSRGFSGDLMTGELSRSSVAANRYNNMTINMTDERTDRDRRVEGVNAALNRGPQARHRCREGDAQSPRTQRARAGRGGMRFARTYAHKDTHARGRPMPSFIHKSTSVSIYSHDGQIAIVAHACVRACVRRACVRRSILERSGTVPEIVMPTTDE